jgi:hypothetical protein
MSVLVVQRTIQIVLLTVTLTELLLVVGYNLKVSAFQFSASTSWSISQSHHHDRLLLDAAVSGNQASFRHQSSLPLGLAIRNAWSLPRHQARRFNLFASSSSSSSSTTIFEETMHRLGLQGEKFDRWRHLQKLLDNETDPIDTNRLVYGVLNRYYNGAKKKIDSNDDNDDDDIDIDTAPERTTERLVAIGKILQEYSSPLHQSIGLMSQKDVIDKSLLLSNGPSSLHNALIGILPHPINEEDEHKGTWDTVMELHGRESVHIEEQKVPNNFAWKERCLAARILIYYDFLDYEESYMEKV